ncbi:MAG: ABC transporter permease subunit [Bacillota bacterium]
MVFRNLLAKELRQLRWIAIIGLLLSAGLAVVMVAAFRYVTQIVDELPPELFEILARYDAAREFMTIFGNYSLYVWSQWNAKNLYQFGSMMVIIIAAVQFAGEVSKKTMGFYLTRPITRNQGFLAKCAAAALLLLVVVCGGIFFIWLISHFLGYSVEWGRLVVATVVTFTWLMVFYLLSAIISILSREPVPAGVIAGISGMALSLPGLFAPIRQFSIFYQMRAIEYFIGGQPPLLSLAASLVIIGLLFFIGMHLFRKRDF